MNPILKTYLRQIDRRLRLRGRDRDAVLAEIRDHLLDDVRRRTAEGAAPDVAARDAIEAFGDPEDLALAYGVDGGIVDRSTGDRILEVAVLTGRAAGRGVGGVAKFAGIAALAIFGGIVVLALGAMVFAGIFVGTFGDEIVEAVPRPVYDRAGSHETTEAWFTASSDNFGLPAEARTLRVFHSVAPENGCLRIELVAPDGTVHGLNGDGCADSSVHVEIPAVAGTWSARYTAIGFVGDFQVDVLYHIG